MKDPLAPASEEIEWFHEHGGYSNMNSIGEFMTFYTSIDGEDARFKRLEMLRTLIQASVECKPEMIQAYFESQEVMRGNTGSRRYIDTTELYEADFPNIVGKMSTSEAEEVAHNAGQALRKKVGAVLDILTWRVF
jgi:hypothetical protein